MTGNNICCPSCNVAVPAVVDEPVVFGCSACYNVFKIDEQGLFQKEPLLPRSISAFQPHWLRPGARIKKRGKVYDLSSAYCHNISWNEYDAESGNYESGVTEYLEWYFVAEDGAEFCLEQTDSDNKFQVREDVPITTKIIQKVESTSGSNDVPEYGTYHLIAFTGQDDEALDRETWNYKVVRDGAFYVSVEWKNGMPHSEWKAHKLRQIGVLELERWKIRSAEEIAEAREKSTKLGFFRDVFGYATLALLVLMFYSGIVSNNSTLCNNGWNFSAPKSDTLSDNPLYQRTYCTMKLEKNRPYRFSSKCSMAGGNGSATFSIAILKLPEGIPVNHIAASFFTESGVDSEGSWTESNLSDYFNFVADETAEYEIFVRVKPESAFDNEVHSGTFHIEVAPILMTRFFVMAMLMCALIWLVYQWRWEYQALQAEMPISTWLQSIFK